MKNFGFARMLRDAADEFVRHEQDAFRLSQIVDAYKYPSGGLLADGNRIRKELHKTWPRLAQELELAMKESEER